MKLLFVLLFLSACHLDELLSPAAPPKQEKKCYFSAYYVRHYAGVTDTVWLGTEEIPCASLSER